MFKTQVETRAFFAAFGPLVAASKHCDIVIAPPFTALAAAVEASKDSSIAIAAQDVHWEKEGAFTGAVSTRMLVEAGCRAVIIGHSERRQYFHEDNATVNRKTKAALAAELRPIVCIGETLPQRESDQWKNVLETQLVEGLAGFGDKDLADIILAYDAASVGLSNPAPAPTKPAPPAPTGQPAPQTPAKKPAAPGPARP